MARPVKKDPEKRPQFREPSKSRFLRGPLIRRVPFFSYCLVLIREPKKQKKGKRVLLTNLEHAKSEQQGHKVEASLSWVWVLKFGV